VGSLNLPPSGSVYLDANAVIYSVEKHPAFGPLLQPVWVAAQARSVEVVSSELVIVETLVGPLKSGDTTLAGSYEQLFRMPQTRLVPVTIPVLRHAAELRATIPSLRTPDAIHAATALRENCSLLLTNDAVFRQVPGLPVAVLRDFLTP
jgi:predicted nucleic acid-binding protein